MTSGADKNAPPEKPAVWLISGELWPRAYLRAELLERGLEAVGFEAIADALGSLHDPRYPSPKLIVLDLHGLVLRRDELSALSRVGIPMIALGGEAELSNELVREVNWHALLKRPYTIGQVVDIIERTLGTK